MRGTGKSGHVKHSTWMLTLQTENPELREMLEFDLASLAVNTGRLGWFEQAEDKDGTDRALYHDRHGIIQMQLHRKTRSYSRTDILHISIVLNRITKCLVLVWSVNIQTHKCRCTRKTNMLIWKHLCFQSTFLKLYWPNLFLSPNGSGGDFHYMGYYKNYLLTDWLIDWLTGCW